MSNIDVQMDYGQVRDMVQAFEQAARQIDDSLGVVQKIAATLEDGALLGLTGDALADALRNNFANSLTRLRDKFEELARDVDAARRFLEEGDQSAASRFL